MGLWKYRIQTSEVKKIEKLLEIDNIFLLNDNNLTHFSATNGSQSVIKNKNNTHKKYRKITHLTDKIILKKDGAKAKFIIKENKKKLWKKFQ